MNEREQVSRGGAAAAGLPLDIESEIVLDIPLQARSLQRLSRRESARYRQARSLLSSGGGPRSLLWET